MSDNENIENTPAADDVEGHRFSGPIRNKIDEDDDVEGHRAKFKNVAEGDDDDVEGHRAKFKNVAEDDDDVEGHRAKKV
jgi:hypothetical protein